MRILGLQYPNTPYITDTSRSKEIYVMGVLKLFGTKNYARKLDIVKKNQWELCRFFLSDFELKIS